MPGWFIKLFTKEGDTVLDPFMGSGTTNLVAKSMGRNSIGIDVIPAYYEMVLEKINPKQLSFMEDKNKYGKTKTK